MRIALYQPDIPQNTGTILRLCACLGIEAHIIAPAGFPTSDRAFRRAGMDYLDTVALVRHTSWQAFEAWRRPENHRLLLFTTAAPASYLDYAYRPDDVLLFGRESAGVPQEVHDSADARLVIPMRPGLRSLNVAVAAAMAAGEALRQTRGMPGAAGHGTAGPAS
jgi:tRNA (cytidine/uridine-2'-O-)-methyltransferase